jgi:hypothetical protein
MTTHSNLKGSRNLQNLRFSGGIIKGTANGGGSGTGSGDATTAGADPFSAISNGAGNGEFTTTSGSSAFIDTSLGQAAGSAAGGGTGKNGGSVGITTGGIGTLKFDGTSSSSGTGGFGAGISPVQFNTVITEVPGSPIPATFKSSKKGGSSGGGVSPPTFITTIVPVSTGPTGGFGSGSGLLNIGSTTEGELISGDELTGVGVGASSGEATSFGGGMASAANFFGTAGGLGSGAGSSAAAAAGNTKNDQVGGLFSGVGGVDGSFSNVGSGTFGSTPSLFPGFP